MIKWQSNFFFHYKVVLAFPNKHWTFSAPYVLLSNDMGLPALKNNTFA